MNERQFSEERFWAKVGKHGRKMGRPLLERVLVLFYALVNPRMPDTARLWVVGALLYLILPADAVPDFLVPLGYTDDMSVILAALSKVSSHVDDETRQRAQRKAESMLGKGERK